MIYTVFSHFFKKKNMEDSVHCVTVTTFFTATALRGSTVSTCPAAGHHVGAGSVDLWAAGGIPCHFFGATFPG